MDDNQAKGSPPVTDKPQDSETPTIEHLAEPEETQKHKPRFEVVTEDSSGSEPVVETVVMPPPAEGSANPEEPAAAVGDLAKVPEESEPKSGVSPAMIAAALVLGIFIGAGSTYFVLGRSSKSAETVIEVKNGAANTPGPAAAVTPTGVVNATPTAEMKRADLKLQVLNGSGVKGAAGIAAEYLKGLGYTVVNTGNADLDNYEMTEFSIKTAKASYTSLLRADLEKDYDVASSAGDLAASSPYDVVVTVGGK